MAITPSAPDLLVVGGTGFLGRRLVGLAGREVTATRRRSAPTDVAADWVHCDLSDGGDAAASLIERLRPAAVVNAAYVPDGPQLDAVTGVAPGRMAAACARVGARFVHVSTDVVFDGSTDRPYTEDDPTCPVHDYGRAKVAAEEAVLAADPAAVIARTSLLWGDRADPGPQVMMTTDPDLTFFDDEFRNPLPVVALAEACLELARRDDITGLLHVAGADTVSRLEFARRVCGLVDVDPASLRGAPTPEGSTRPRNCPLDSSRARARLRTPLPGVHEDES